MIRNRYKEKKKLFPKVIIDLLDTNQHNTLLLNDATIEKLKTEIL